MPYPSEHAGRIIDPSKFEKDSFRRKNISKGIDIILGRLKGETTLTTQAYRFKKDMFTVDEAKKWLQEHDIKTILFEKAEEKKEKKTTQSFQQSIVLFEKRIQSFTQNEILKVIPTDILEKIKKKDSHPFFQMYSLCHEGISTPTIIGEKAQPIAWPKKAIQSIKNIITKGIKLFKGHNKDNSTNNRKEIGEVIHSFEKEMDGKLHHVIITYHDPIQRKEAMNYDIISQEADWNFFESAGQLIADTIDKLTGIAMGNSAYENPAFSGAKRLGFIQAFEKIKKENIKGDIMSDEIIVDGESTNKKNQMSFKQWISLRKHFNVYPRQIVTLDELKADREFGKYFDELDSSKEKIDNLNKVIETKDLEIIKLKKQIHLDSAGNRLNDLMKLKNYPEKMRPIITKIFEKQKDNVNDLSDKGLEKFLDQYTNVVQDVLNTTEEQLENIPKQSKEEEQEKKDSGDINKAESNEFLDEDLDDELFPQSYDITN
jgi:hypothetical protein